MLFCFTDCKTIPLIEISQTTDQAAHIPEAYLNLYQMEQIQIFLGCSVLARKFYLNAKVALEDLF